MSIIEDTVCPLQERCPNIHVTLEGYQKRRIWVDAALRTGRRGEHSSLCAFESGLPICGLAEEDMGCMKGDDFHMQEQCQMPEAYVCQPGANVCEGVPWRGCDYADVGILEDHVDHPIDFCPFFFCVHLQRNNSVQVSLSHKGLVQLAALGLGLGQLSSP